MYRTIICACIALLSAIANMQAQTPTYQYTINSPSSPSSSATGQEFRQQCLYTHSNFPGMPAGRVKAIYFRAAVAYNIMKSTSGPCRYEQFTAKIGYTADSAFKLTGNDTFRAGLTTVFGPDSLIIPCTGAAGAWIRIPVTKGKFYYDPEQYFVVEMACGPASVKMFAFPDIANNVRRSGYRASMYVLDRNETKFTGLFVYGVDLGLDLGNPADVAGLSNISAFGLFPNPAAGGRFNVSLEASHPVKEIVVTVSNAVGQVLQRQAYAQPGSVFFQEVNLSGAAAGHYFVEVVAGGERVVRRVIIE